MKTIMKKGFLFLILFATAVVLPAQSCGFSVGKSLTQLQAAVYDRSLPGQEPPWAPELGKPALIPDSAVPLHPVFLPRWTAETLPFFCKIEHDWARKSRIPLKFRLGSVEYVDWLEGKGH